MAAPSTTETRLAFAILGALRVTNSDAEIDLGGRQQRVVLARLIVNGASGASLEQLADMLWGDRTRAASSQRSTLTCFTCAKFSNRIGAEARGRG